MPSAPIGPPALAAPAGALTIEASAPASAPPAEHPPSLPPLDLRLPPAMATPRTMQQQAVDDDRATTRRRTFEERMAADLSQDDTRETLADGSIRHRRGARCSIEHPSRAGQLFAMDDAARRAPSGWGPCP